MMVHRRTGMGDVTKTQLTQSTVPLALTTAAMFDPEPISKVALLVAGAVAAPIIGLFSGCGQTCVIATQIVNKVEPLMNQNLQAYLQSARTVADQQKALANFDQLWQYVVDNCSNAQLSAAGQRCISDRQAGACVWKNDGQGGPAGSGDVCWNWFVGYRDPIANDTPTDAGTVSGAVSGAVASLSNPSTWLSNPVALAAAGLILVGVAS